MFYKIKLKLESPILGEKRDKDVRRLNKKNDYIIINKEQWATKFFKSATDLGLVVDLNSIRFDESYLSPSIHLYRRKYNKIKFELFECLRTGTVITTYLLLDNNPAFPITDDEVNSILGHMGKYYGITEWGEKFGYGRFKVLELTNKRNEANNSI